MLRPTGTARGAPDILMPCLAGHGKGMHRLALLKLPLIAGLLASSALAGGSWRAWSDQTQLPPLAEHRDELTQDQDRACTTAVRDPRTPGLAPGGGQNLDKMIKDLGRMLAGMKPSDPAYLGLQQSLKQLTQMRRSGVPPLPTGTATGAMPFKTALAMAEKLVGAQASEVRSAVRSDDVAAAMAAGSPRLALALLLAAHRANPESAWTLVNAAGVLSLAGLPTEAVAFLDQADRLGGSWPAPGGVPGRALALSNRGHALLGLGRWKEAETPLRAALKLAPDLAEAHANLSEVLLCQGQLDAATREARAAMRRTPDSQAGADLPLKESVPNRHGGGLQSVTNAASRRPARDLFDLSRGATFNLPPLKLPRHRRDAIKLHEHYLQLERTGQAELRAISAQAARRSNEANLDAGEQRWKRLVDQAINTASFEPELWGAYRAAWEAHYAFWDAVPRFAEARNTALRAASDFPSCAARDEARDKAEALYLGGLRPFAVGQEHAMAHYVSLLVKHQTALAANLPDPAERAAARLRIESSAKSLFYGPIVGAAIQMSDVSKTVCDQNSLQPVSLDLPPLPELSADPCGGVVASGKLKSKVPLPTLKAAGLGLSFGVSCRGLDLELSPRISAAFGVGLFTGAKLDWNGSGTLFFGIKAELKQPKGTPGSSVNKSGLGVKESMYLKFDGQGVVDAGLRIEGKVSLGAGPDTTAGVWEAKLDQEFGIAAAAAYWRER
ncbi:hypothetical protein SAMN00790413_06565 [Deinococcus hopiensis KR-140]|uniref:Uncharacterized protein n=2 Tax=Deinococcus TaxID=1298 RepID=A0A1W1UAV4_9DEIO|nr:hypothetical protein SAMN00790413_06565 [Deinococcus hopiensis KR-140]